MPFKLAELLGIGVDKAVDSVNNILKDNIYSKQDKADHELRLEELEYRVNELDYEELEKERDHEEKLIELTNQDKADARLTERAALETDDLFVRRFRYYLASIMLLLSFTLIFLILLYLFLEAKNHFADTILGFIMGTVVGTIISYFFSTTYSSHSKDDTINKLSKKL